MDNARITARCPSARSSTGHATCEPWSRTSARGEGGTNRLIYRAAGKP